MGLHSRQIKETAERVREEIIAWMEECPYDASDFIEEETVDTICMEIAEGKLDDFYDMKYESMKDERMLNDNIN